MKKIIIPIVLLFITLSVSAQIRKPDSLQVQITMDSNTYKFIISLIRENIDARTSTGKVILSNILQPLYNYKMVADTTKSPAKKPKK